MSAAGRRAGGGGPTAYLARADLRRRWPQLVALAVLAGLALGASLGTLAGARRTATAYGRHLEASHAADMELNPGGFDPESDRRIRRLPGVEEVSYWAALPLVLIDRNGEPVTGAADPITFTSDGRFLTMDRLSLAAGRMPRIDRPDEALVNQTVLDQNHHVRLGGRLTYRYYHYGEDGVPAFDEPARFVRVRIVGVMVHNDDVVPDPLDVTGRVLLSPALLPKGPEAAAQIDYPWYGLRLRDGEAGVHRVEEAWRSIVAEHNRSLAPDDEQGRWIATIHSTADVRSKAERAIQPLVTALVLFGALAFLATVAFTAVAAARLAAANEADLRTGRVLGLDGRSLLAIGMAVPITAVVAATAVALLTAVAVSVLFPVGPFRAIEPSTGLQLDALVVGAGSAVFLLTALAAVALRLRRVVRTAPLASPTTVLHPSRTASILARAGLPVSFVLGARQALEPGRGRSAVPTRSTLASLTTAVLMLVTTVVFAANLRGLQIEPERFGWKADAVVVAGGGYDFLRVGDASRWFRSHGAERWRFAAAARTQVNGTGVPAVAFGPGAARFVPTLIDGRAPGDAGEVVLGTETLQDLGLHVGDRVDVGEGRAKRSARITGTAVFPVLGPVLAVHTGLGRGVWLDRADTDALGDIGSYPAPYNFALLDLRPGVTVPALNRAIQRVRLSSEGGDGVAGVLRPPEITTAVSLEGGQFALSALLAAVSLVVLALTLSTVVRRRGRELALHRALGFTARQAGAAMAWQALTTMTAALLVGLPLGLAFGRWLWSAFAGQIHVVPAPEVPALALSALILGLLVVAGLVSLRSAVRAAGRGPAGLLRAE